MEAIKTRLKTIAWFLTALMLFQSCVIYHKTPTTLEKASQEQVKTKITNSQGQVFKYKYLSFEDDQFFGLEEVELGELIRVPIKDEGTLLIRTQDKNASTWATIGLCTVGLGVIIVLIATSFDISYGDSS